MLDCLFSRWRIFLSISIDINVYQKKTCTPSEQKSPEHFS